MKKSDIFSFLLLFSFNLFGQTPPSWTSAEMYQAIKKLNVLGSVLYVAAHPDDENTRLIAFLSKDRLYQTGYLSMTRGDGGQNLVGEEQGIDLGLIRTQELLSARRIDGGEQFFTRAFDFGYSKNPEETFTKWHKEKILSDVVWVIRKFQPDVIITRFPTTGEGGHGHHTASAILAEEAFTAAANPNSFPEQLKYVQPWQVKRVLWNTFNFGGNNTQREDQFKFDVGGYNVLLGKSYGEISSESRSQHKSQGFGVPAGRGEALEYFSVIRGDKPLYDLMEGIDLSWKRVAGGQSISVSVEKIAAGFDFLHPEKSVKSLVQLYKDLAAMPPSYWRNKKMDETKELVAQCSGLWIDVYTQEQYAVQTDSIRFNFQFNNRLGVQAELKGFSVDGIDSLLSRPLLKNANVNFSKTIFVPATKPVTQPYWLINRMEEGYFNVTDQTMIGIPDAQAAYLVKLNFIIEGEKLSFTKPVKYKFTDPVKGELYWPLVVMPVVTFKDYDQTFIKGEKENSVEISFAANKKIDLPSPILAMQGNSSTGDTVSKLIGGFSLQKKQFFSQTLRGADLEAKVYKINISPEAHQGGMILKTINYDHIPSINYFKEALLTVKKIELKTEGKKVGYIVGAGDKVPLALEQMGYEVTLLGDKELSRNNLEQYDAIITGVRAYNTNEWLNNYYDKLMKYVEQGGNMIVQYNTNNFLGGVRAKVGPYPFTINRNRITDENAVVKFLNPEHPAFNFPNKITAEDFTGWIQERSIYHATDTSGKFEKLISMKDPGENDDDGSLLVAKYGKGFFTYTGLVFFRELPAGIPGAYRVLANLIALNRKKAF